MAEDKKRTYQSTTLGVPPLKMVLVHARNAAQNATSRKAKDAPKTAASDQEVLDKEAVVRRLIEHLEAVIRES